MLRILVCGSRTWTDAALVACILGEYRPGATTIIHGACPTGADAIADRYATASGYAVERFPADWSKHGKAAGMIRNARMIATRPDLVIAFHDGVSRGTADTIARARRAGVPVRAVRGEGTLADRCQIWANDPVRKSAIEMCAKAAAEATRKPGDFVWWSPAEDPGGFAADSRAIDVATAGQILFGEYDNAKIAEPAFVAAVLAQARKYPALASGKKK